MPPGAGQMANMPGEPPVAGANHSPPAAQPPAAAATGGASLLPPGVGAQNPPPAPARPARKQPRFIAADSNRSRFQLGADGNLPQLALQEASGKREQMQEQASSSNPLMLIIVLGISLTMSVVMLLVDFDNAGQRITESAAREQLEMHYVGSEGDPAPYQRLLRQALQAHSRGDYNTERRRLREVLDMLHSEGKNRFTGLTGVPDADYPPNDAHLEQQLARLLNE